MNKENINKQQQILVKFTTYKLKQTGMFIKHMQTVIKVCFIKKESTV